MRTLAAAFAVLLAGAMAYAQQPSSDSGQMPDSGKQKQATSDKDWSKDKSGKPFKAEVVSTDATAHTITVRKSDHMAGSSSGTSTSSASNEMTLSVDPKLESSLSSFTAGEQVKIWSKTDASGKQIATKIERADNRPASDQPPKP